MVDWRQPMALAMEQARLAAGHGEVPIGAVVVDRDVRPIAAAGNERELSGDPTAHAELLAIRKAIEGSQGWRRAECTLVVTLEPCTMCAGALVQARIPRLVFGAYDPKAGAVASLWDVVRDARLNHRVEVVGGIAEQECAQLLSDFFSDRR